MGAWALLPEGDILVNFADEGCELGLSEARGFAETGEVARHTEIVLVVFEIGTGAGIRRLHAYNSTYMKHTGQTPREPAPISLDGILQGTRDGTDRRGRDRGAGHRAEAARISSASALSLRTTRRVWSSARRRIFGTAWARAKRAGA